MSGCAPVLPEKGPRLQLQVCPQCRLCRGDGGVGHCSLSWAAHPLQLAGILHCLLQGLRSSCLMGSARPLAATGGCGKALNAAGAS